MNRRTHILACSRTDPGLQRLRNEDVCQADTAPGRRRHGRKGGRKCGKRMFREAVMEVFDADEELGLTEGEAKVHEAFSLANRKILAHVDDNPHHSGMGCTADLLIFCQNRHLIGHVGDSRTYLFRGNRIHQLTRDHSFVQDQVDKGIITPQQAQKSRFRNILMRAIGVDPFLAVDIVCDRHYPGDIFLLCTDGLRTMLSTVEITSILAFQGSLTMKADMLINRANDSGGNDNIAVPP